jgi:hypothetical protein
MESTMRPVLPFPRSTRLRRALALTPLVAILGMPLGAQALSQTTPTDPVPLAPAPQAARVDDAELQKFAQAAGEIRELRRKWMPEVAAAERKGGPEAALKVEDEAYAEMIGAVENKGLSLQRFNQIVAMAQTDQELQERLATHMAPSR